MNKHELLYEMAKSEDFSQYDMDFVDTMSSIKKNLSNIATLPNRITYTAEMVNVIAGDAYGDPNMCLVEAENLLKYMQSEGLEVGDIETAISNVAKANGIDVNDIALVIDSNAKITQCCEEAAAMKDKCDGSKNRSMRRLRFMTDVVKNCYNKGIRVVKRAD